MAAGDAAQHFERAKAVDRVRDRGIARRGIGDIARDSDCVLLADFLDDGLQTFRPNVEARALYREEARGLPPDFRPRAGGQHARGFKSTPYCLPSSPSAPGPAVRRACPQGLGPERSPLR